MVAEAAAEEEAEEAAERTPTPAKSPGHTRCDLGFAGTSPRVRGAAGASAGRCPSVSSRRVKGWRSSRTTVPRDRGRDRTPRASGRGSRSAGPRRAAEGEEWEEHDVVFTRPDGRPLDPRADWEEFKELLEEAGISDRRLYDGSRHTAGTILNELWTCPPSWRSCGTPRSARPGGRKGRSALSKDAMRRMGEFFVPRPENLAAIKTDSVDTRAARSCRRRRIR